MTQVSIPVALGEVLEPLFNFGGVHFDDGATVSTGQVMVMRVDVTAPKEALAAVGHHRVNFAPFHQPLQLGVDRRQRDASAVTNDRGVQFLGTHETLYATECSDDFATLGGISRARHDEIVLRGCLHFGIIPIILLGMIPELFGASRSATSPRVVQRGVQVVGVVALVVVVVVGLMVALTGHARSGPGSATTPHVVRAIGAENEYANVVAQIGGRYVSVSAVMDNPNTDPHAYQVSTGVAQSIAAAQLVVQNGVGYDGFMNQLESASPSRSRDVIDVQRLLGLSSNTRNPHLWYAPNTMARVARQIAKDLASIEPAHAQYFARQFRTFLTSLRSLRRAISSFRGRFGAAPVATTEPVADYLLTALGVRNLTPFRFQQDVMNGVDPSPEDSAYEQRLLSQHRVKLLCYNAQVLSTATASLQALALQSGIPVVAVYETMPTPGYTYQTWMLAEIHAMAQALGSKISTEKL